MPTPTVADVDAVAAIADPVVRNLRITQCYHELSAAVATRAAPGANWCTFATWASRQAGQTIRRQDIQRAVDDVLGAPEVRRLLEHAVRLAVREGPGRSLDALAGSARRILDVEGALQRASDAVAVGNRKVFAEIGREFARWLGSAAAEGSPDEQATRQFCQLLRPGEPPEGQRLLGEAFAAFGDACHATDATSRAERLLLGNLLVGVHEQTRLQPQIAASLDAAIDGERIRGELLSHLLPGRWRRWRAALARLIGRPLPLDAAINALLAAVRTELRRVLTARLMTLRLPGTVVRLGQDLTGPFAPELQRPVHPPLVALLASVDATPDDVRGTGASDWANLSQRMHFIADLFRCWHGRAELLGAPFTAEQVAAMRAGRVPAGEL